MALQPSFTSYSSYSSSSSFSYGCSYDVFLSFRGTDTRYGFTGYLLDALKKRGIHTFFDDQELKGGEEITPTLDKAIEESRIAIPVFSANYAYSKFCLDELLKIMECFKGKGRLVLPVFYYVDPCDVRHQRGSYGEALIKHEERFKDDMEKVQKWRMALHQVANLSGYHFKHGDGYEHKFIEKIVRAVSGRIKGVMLPVADYPVGLDSQVPKVTSLLDVGSNDRVHMVGIYGIGGVGKTTLALAVYNLITDHFEGSCFLENVRENSNKRGLAYLQSILFSELLGEKKVKLASVQQGVSIMQHRFQKKKVLLILDDVDKYKQLQTIVGKQYWFGPGSRVIITTRDKHLLACHGVERTYEVKGLNMLDALELLSWKAFKTINVNPIYTDVLNRVATYACGLPLALEVIGSNLFEKSIEEWESALDRYKKIPNDEIHQILKVSFDALEEVEQNVFLDIACSFKGYELTEVEDILNAHHGGCVKYHIGVLVKKSLMKIGQFGKVKLHDLIEDMGKEIIRQESPKNLGKRSRLWFHEDIVQVLEDNQGSTEIELIHLDFPSSEDKKEVKWDGKAFGKMKNLKTLIIRNDWFSEGPNWFLEGPKFLPNSLRVLEWWRYPSQSLPYNFHPKNLSILKLPNYCCMSLDLVFLSKDFVKLKVLNLDHNIYLTEIPDVSSLPNLEKLSVNYCENLSTVHNSVGLLDKLKILSALDCYELTSFPPIKLPSLETLCLSRCVNLEKFPEILGKMENITKLVLYDTCTKLSLPAFRNLTRLQELYLETMIPELDEGEETMSSMVSTNVEFLTLNYCNLTDDILPIGLAWFANVKELDLSFNDFTILPECIKECRFLWKLEVNYCHQLREIRGIPPYLEHFLAVDCGSLCSLSTSMLLNQELHEAGNTRFTLPGSRVPEWFEHRSRGPSISFWFRNKFPTIALCLAFGPMDDRPFLWPSDVSVSPIVIINGNKHFTDHDETFDFCITRDHIQLFDLREMKFHDNLDEDLLENEWNHAEVSSTTADYNRVRIMKSTKEIGIHVFKHECSMEDIQFVNPYKRIKLHDGLICAQEE